MADVVDVATRSRMMSGIRGQNTKPEILVRSLLHRNGYRFRLHSKDLPGRPDIVLPKHRTVVFVHGCYWHAHDKCSLFRLPKSDDGFWADKLTGNRARDERNVAALRADGWNVIVVWECAVSKARRLEDSAIMKQIGDAIANTAGVTNIRSVESF